MARVKDNLNTTWNTFHDTIDVSEQTINNVMVIRNEEDDFIEAYNDALLELKAIIGTSIMSNRRVKVSGGRWSFTKMAFSTDINISPTGLSKQRRLYDNEIDNNCPILSENLLICQSGAKIQNISGKLRRKKKSLITSGASNGQTIAGAISTGTHGANIKFGSMQEMVVGLHIIVDGNTSVLIESEEVPITNQKFRDDLGVDVFHQDTELFNAALVGLGSFGYIYGVIIKVTDIYILRNYILDMQFTELEELLENGLDFQNSAFQVTNEVGNDPEHLKVLIDPYNKQCKAEIMYKKDYPSTYSNPFKKRNNLYNPDILNVIGKITQVVPPTVALFLSALRSNFFPSNIDNGLDAILAHHFRKTTTAGKTFSTAIGLPLDKAKLALNNLIDLINANTKLPAILSMRFVKGTNALMGFTHFENSVILEIDGIRNNVIEDFIQKIPAGFKAAGIDKFTFHWGKDNPLDLALIREMYGDRYELWKKKRSQIMSDEAIDLYCTDYANLMGFCEKTWTLSTDDDIT